MVDLRGVSYRVGKKALVQEISVSLEAGRMHLILGPNGAGKSTLIKLISGEHRPSTGSITIGGRPLSSLSLAEQARQRAVLSQNTELSFPLSVEEVVMLGRYPHFAARPGAEDRNFCAAAMDLFGITDMADRNYLTLSGGEKQRVQFARVFAQIGRAPAETPKLLLLDEPLTFLDIFYQYDLMTKTREFMVQHAGLTVIGVVHDLNIAARFADRVMLLRAGEVFAYGTPDTVMTEERLGELFRVKVEDRFRIR